MTPPAGRPPSTNPKTRTRQIRLTTEQDDHIAHEADQAGVSFAEYVREKILPKRLQ